MLARRVSHSLILDMHHQDLAEHQPEAAERDFLHEEHSIETGASAMRGTATRNEGTSDKPASFGSSTPLGNAIDVTRISCASANGTRLTTNCSLVRILARVSFGSAGPLLPMPMPTVAGSLPKTLKNENGAALIAPAASRVVTHAIGRGKTVASSNL